MAAKDIIGAFCKAAGPVCAVAAAVGALSLGLQFALPTIGLSKIACETITAFTTPIGEHLAGACFKKEGKTITAAAKSNPKDAAPIVVAATEPVKTGSGVKPHGRTLSFTA